MAERTKRIVIARSYTQTFAPATSFGSRYSSPLAGSIRDRDRVVKGSEPRHLGFYRSCYFASANKPAAHRTAATSAATRLASGKSDGASNVYESRVLWLSR